MNFLWSSNLFNKNKEEEQVIDVLKNCFLFNTLSSKELMIVRESVHVRRYNVGENVFQQHQQATGMYIVVNGKVSIESEKISYDQKTDAERKTISMLETLKAGDFFGELALVEDESIRTATAKTIEPSLIIGFFKPDLIEIINARPTLGVKLCLKLAQILGQRLKEAGLSK